MLRENLFILYVDDFLEGDSFMNGLLLLGLSALILVVAYLFYGRYLVKTWGIDPNLLLQKKMGQTLYLQTNGQSLLINSHQLQELDLLLDQLWQ